MAEALHERSSTEHVRARLTDRRLGLPAVLLVALLWRLPSFFDPPWVNDEGTYFAVAQAMAHGYSLYTGVWENKPPAVYLVYSAVYHPFGPSLMALRLVTAIAVLVLVWRSWHLAQHFLGEAWSPAAAVATGLVFGVPFLEGTTGNAEVFVALLAACAVEQSLVRRRWWLAGAFMGLAILFKVVAVFDAAALGLTLFGAASGSGRIAFRLRDIVAYAASGVVVGVACLAAAREGILRGMMNDAFLYDLGYVGHGNGGSIPWLLVVKAAVLLILTVFAWRRPFPVLWLIYATFGALLSGRVFGHYLLQPALPSVLVMGLFFRREQRDIARRAPAACVAIFLAIGLLAASVGWAMAASGHDSILARRLQYYPNFVRYAAHREPYAEYESQIDDHVLRNEGVVRQLRALPPGRLLVWGNTPWIYALSGRLPATRFTSALRSPEVPGETSALRRAVQRRAAAIVVVISPPAPSLGNAEHSLNTYYRKVHVVGTALIYALDRRR